MPLSETGLVNIALREIGEYRITDINEDSPAAEIARDLMDHTRRLALGAHEWRFAMKQVQLATVPSEVPVARYDFTWQLPSDFIRLGSVSDNETMEPELRDYMQLGPRRLLSSSEFMYIEYVFDVPIISEWPGHFVHYMAAQLAAEMASPLKATTERERLEKLLIPRLAHARTLDSITAPTIIRTDSNWLRAMRGRSRMG